MQSPAEQVLDIFEAYATDEDAENNGRWFPLGKGGHVKVARTGNENYSKLFKKLVEAKEADLNEGGPAADALANEILLQVESQTVLVDWKGIGFQGKQVEYSPEMAKTMLGVKDFRRKINALAGSFENYRIREEQQAGNA